MHHNVFYISLLRPYIASGDGIEGLHSIIIDNKPEWEVETIFCHCHHRGIQQYLVKYIGYDQSEAMWLDEDEMVYALDVLKAYKQQIA